MVKTEIVNDSGKLPEVCMVIEKSHPILTKHDMKES